MQVICSCVLEDRYLPGPLIFSHIQLVFSHLCWRRLWPVQVIELVNELIDEMDLADEAITEKATEHIHANEVILTFGLSQTTLKFLIRAAERRKFQV